MPVKLDIENDEARATRIIHRSGNSTVLGIPPELMDVVDFELGDEVELTVNFETGEIVVRPVTDDTEEEQSDK